MLTHALVSICLATIGWVYAGFPVTLAALARVTRRETKGLLDTSALEPVTLVIPAYNEADEVEAKLANTQSLIYPEGRLRVLWVTDGSTDDTPERLRALGQEVLHDPKRGGKAAAINRAMGQVDTPWVVFTDANTQLRPDALLEVLRPLLDPEVGCVAGAKRVHATDNGAGESAYWRYEDAIKRLESQLHSTMGAAGELVAMRVRCFRELPADTVLDDFVMSMRAVVDGYRTVYAPDAVASEPPSATPADDFERRARIAAGGLQALTRLPELCDPRQVSATVAFCHLSHRVLRWTVAPAALLALPALLIAHALAAPSVASALAVGGQSAVLLGVAARLTGRVSVPGFAAISHFYLANLAIVVGWLRFLRGRQPAAWNRVARAPSV